MAEKLSTKQQRFTWMVGQLIQFAYNKGYGLTFGDAFARVEDGVHSKNSYHYQRLAVDLNLFKHGKYMTKTEEYAELGEFWKKIGGSWGGDFRNQDGNHFSLGE